jgi:hypothetical protein
LLFASAIAGFVVVKALSKALNEFKQLAVALLNEVGKNGTVNYSFVKIKKGGQRRFTQYPLQEEIY